MKIAIIGAGNVGRSLAIGWQRCGHTITLGGRDATSEKARAAASALGLSVVPPEAAAKDAEVLLLATPWPRTEEALRGLGNIAGKVLLDATNPLKADYSGLTIGTTESGGECVARWAAGAQVVKIFNSTGYQNMVSPIYGNDRATMFYCGDDRSAKAVAHSLAADLGFDPIDAGPLSEARMLEPLAMLWIHLAIREKLGRDVAFRLLRRTESR